MKTAFDLAVAQHWAMTEPALRQLLAVADRRGDLQALEAALGEELDGAERAYVRDGVAVIPIRGPLFRYANLLTRVSGATSYSVTARDLATALDDPAVHAILLDVDSPGGEVNGAHELAEMIYAAREVKPVVAYVGGMGASGGYWLASAASEIVADETAMLGSIGVIWATEDRSKADEKAGIREIIVVSDQSPHKDTDPATDEGFGRMRALATQLADVFIRSVARNRGVSVEHVINEFGRGWLKTGQDALDVELADRFGSFESALAELAEHGNAAPKRMFTLTAEDRMGISKATASAAAKAADEREDEREDEEEEEAKQKSKSKAKGKGKAEKDEDEDEEEDAKAAGPSPDAIRAQERERILGIAKLSIPGMESLIAECQADAGCTVEMAALRLIQAQQKQGNTVLAALKNDEASLEKPAAGANAGIDAPSPDAEAERLFAASPRGRRKQKQASR